MPAVASSSRSPLVAAIIVVALGGLVVLNMFQERNDPKYQERMERDRQREQSKKQAEQAAKQPTAEPGKPGAGQELVAYGAEKVLGNPSGTPTITVGWRWTPEVQGAPSKIAAAVEALEKSAGSAKIRVVNLDAKPGAVPEGIAVDGRAIMPLVEGGGLPPAQAIGSAIPGMLAGMRGGMPGPGGMPPGAGGPPPGPGGPPPGPGGPPPGAVPADKVP